MPVHFNSIIKKESENKVLSSILENNLDNPDDVFVPSSKDRFLIINNIVDEKTNNTVGRITITFITRNNAHELVDIDITLNSTEKIKLNFEEKYDKSSESNEYYQVSSEDDVHFDIETVGRFRIDGDLEGTTKEVSLSAFPFKANIYDSIDDANEDLGFKPVNVPGIENPVMGLSETFMGCGFGENNEIFSIIVGKIKSFNDVETFFGKEKVSFTIINIETAVGILPVAINLENFDMNNIKEDQVMIIYTDVKAEF